MEKIYRQTGRYSDRQTDGRAGSLYTPPLAGYDKMFQYRHSKVILCNVGEDNIFEHGCYISALEHVRIYILGNYVF